MRFTDNYNLNLPDLADQYNLEHWNENTSKIDEQLKIDENNLNSHKSDLGNPHQVKGSQLTEPVPTDKIADYSVTTDKLSRELQDLLLPAGKIEYLAFVPDGNWLSSNKRLICDGSEVSRTDYPRLFNAIGTTFGVGDGSTTFNLPNYIGKMLFGSKTTVTEEGGNKTATLSTSNIPSHTHTMNHTHNMNHSHTVNTNYIVYCDVGGANTTRVGDANVQMQGLYLKNLLSINEFSGTTKDSSSSNTGSTGDGTSFPIMNPYNTAVPVITY